jgi:NAD/NADP transhydrogenase alpha subunit
LYARNVQALLELMLDGSEEGHPRLRIDFADEILAGACVHRGHALDAAGIEGPVTVGARA